MPLKPARAMRTFALTCSTALPLSMAASAAAADVPKVVTDIAPVQSLVAQVMGDLGDPVLLVDPKTNPHFFVMRPSQARALSKADLVVWIGPELTPWLSDPVETLSADAQALGLLSVPGIETKTFREEAVFLDDDHDGHDDHDDHDGHDDHAGHDDHDGHDDHAHEGHDDHDDHDDHAHDDHADDHHDEHKDHDDHADHDGHDDHDDHGDHGDAHGHHHDHDGTDPHAWLDPENARVWLGVIADRLSQLDPEHADTYQANAAAASAELAALTAELQDKLAPLAGRPLLTQHDAYHYFEDRFGLSVLGAIRESDATDPSPARLRALQDAMAEHGVACIFTEPQFRTGPVEALAESAGAGLAELDPLGANQTVGPDLYAAVLRELGDQIDGCQ